MRWLKIIGILLVILAIVYFLGPHPKHINYTNNLPVVPSAENLNTFLGAQEALHKLRVNNEARVVWFGDSVKKTNYSIVYLHGFSASQEEGNPVHRNIANTFKCNLFLSRLAEHGIDTSEQLLNLNSENYWESAKQALAIGKQIGNKVILMGTSTGASQALQLAAMFPNDVAAVVLYSPNIAINDGNAWILNNPWGLQIARKVKKSNYNTPDDKRDIYKQYWNTPYRLEATVTLEEMLEATMKKTTFEKIKQPLLMLYYYKDEQHQDNVVKVSAMKEMFAQLSTDSLLKRAVAIPNAGDHVMASPIKSGDVQSVENETKKFLEEVVFK